MVDEIDDLKLAWNEQTEQVETSQRMILQGLASETLDLDDTFMIQRDQTKNYRQEQDKIIALQKDAQKKIKDLEAAYEKRILVLTKMNNKANKAVGEKIANLQKRISLARSEQAALRTKFFTEDAKLTGFPQRMYIRATNDEDELSTKKIDSDLEALGLTVSSLE